MMPAKHKHNDLFFTRAKATFIAIVRNCMLWVIVWMNSSAQNQNLLLQLKIFHIISKKPYRKCSCFILENVTPW